MTRNLRLLMLILALFLIGCGNELITGHTTVYTVLDLFAIARSPCSLYNNDAAMTVEQCLTFSFDPTTGVPAEIDVDCLGMADEDYRITVKDFQVTR